MVKKTLAFAGVLYPKTCAQMRLYLDKILCNIAKALEESTLAKCAISFRGASFDEIAHEALLGFMTLAKHTEVKRIFLISPLKSIEHLHKQYQNDTEAIFICEADAYELFSREIPAIAYDELASALGRFQKKQISMISAQIPTALSEIYLPFIGYAFREREIAIRELFVRSLALQDLLEALLSDSRNAVVLLDK